MKTYLVHESNMERLNKKMASLKKKCAQSNCSFTYNVVGEQFKTVETVGGDKYIAKYFEVEVDGEAKYNGWRFIATLDHHSEGNVVRAYDTEITIPDRFKTCGPTCEHCNMIRSRKDTYLIYNDEKNEFKQVGKSCLMEFTGGLSAENIAFFCSIYEAAERSYGYSGPNYTRYVLVEDITRYAFECYRHWGYNKSAYSLEFIPQGYKSTSERVSDYYFIDELGYNTRKECFNEMNEVGFDANSEYAVSNTKDALEWIRNVDKSETDKNEYLRNLHVVASGEYTDRRSIGILVSLTSAYRRHLEEVEAYIENQKRLEGERENSEYVGSAGDRIEFKVSEFNLISSWDNMYGTTWLYRFKDESGNVFVWYASNSIGYNEIVTSIKGTVKDHSEYKGIKQTVLTRCNVTTVKPEKEVKEDDERQSEVEEAIDAFLEIVNS